MTLFTFIVSTISYLHGSEFVLVVKSPLANAGDIRDAVSSTRLGGSPGGGNDNPLQYSCLESHMDRGAWWATAHGVTKSWTQLNDLACIHQTYIYHSSASHNLKLYCSLRYFQEIVMELLLK